MILKKETTGFLVSKKLNIICFVVCLLFMVQTAGVVKVQADDELTTSINGKQKVYEGCVYDSDTGFYSYTLSDSPEVGIYSNILNGAYTNSNVKVGAVSSVSYTVYRDGQEFKDFVDGRISEPGDYAVTVYSNTGKQETILKFTIVGKFTNLKRMDMPGMCTVEKVVLDGDEIPYNTYYVLFDSEGEYEITYRIGNLNKLETVKFTIDITPPVITFDGLNEKNEANGPVTMIEIEEKCTVKILRDGKEIDFSKNLDQSGMYRVTIQDEASNQTVYDFTIYPYFNISSFLFIGLCVLLLVLIVMYVFFVRKNLRVR